MPDDARVQALLDRLEGELRDLRRLAGYPREELDADRLASAKYRLVVAIEICIDIANHLIVSRSLRAPDTYSDTFAVLGEGKLLSDDLVESLKGMAGFRNLLVHQYLDVDDERVVEILKTRLEDFEAFRREIARSTLGDRR